MDEPGFDFTLLPYVVNELVMEGELELDWAMALRTRLNRHEHTSFAGLQEMVTSFLPSDHARKVFERMELYRQLAAAQAAEMGKPDAKEKAVLLQ